MEALRRARTLVRLVLAWFALSIGVAVASPMFNPQGMELVCSGSGVMKVVLKANDGSKQQSGPTLDCPLCAHIAPAPPVVRAAAEPPHPLSHALRPAFAAHIAWLTAAPPPARGPPPHA
jgi:hypothetical protein